MFPAIKAILLFMAIASDGDVLAAQVKCTMPNGVVITQQLSSCPKDAIKAETLDGTTIKSATSFITQPQPTATPETTAHELQSGSSAANWAIFALITYAVWRWIFGKKWSARTGSNSRKIRYPLITIKHITSSTPITKETDAVKALEKILGSVGYFKRSKAVIRTTLNDFKLEMKEHIRDLQDTLELAKDELLNRCEIAEIFTENDEDEIVKKQSPERPPHPHSAEIFTLREEVDAISSEISAFHKNRATFITAYANHILHDFPSPVKGRN